MFTWTKTVGIASIILSLITATASPAPGPIRQAPPPELDVANPCIMSATHDRNNAWITVCNWGGFGNTAYPYQSLTPACEFPGGSDVQYLCWGALWVGALMVDEGCEFPAVSVGSEGWFGYITELYPGEGIENGMKMRSNVPGTINWWGENCFSPDAVSPQEFIATYSDTLTETFWVQPDPFTGPHTPLGVKIRQESMCWDSYGFDDYIMFNYTLENIRDDTLKNLYLGWLIDADVGWEGEAPHYHQDDLTGFLGESAGETWNIAWAADNDGRPYNAPPDTNFTAPGVAATYALLSPDDIYYISYNWWISNGDPVYDYGPSWLDTPEPSTHTYGTPLGDNIKYFLMTNKEIDFDQVYVNSPEWITSHPQELTDPFTGETEIHQWMLPDIPNAYDVANGYNTKYLMSWGPFGENVSPPGQVPETYFYPGDSLKFSIAYVCGDQFHDTENPQPNPEIIDPSLFVFDDLVYNCGKAQFLVDHNFHVLPPYAPAEFRITNSTEDFVRLGWGSYLALPNTGVNIYRRTEESGYGDTPINSTPITGIYYNDYNIALGTRYFYQAQAVRHDSLLSYFTDEVTIVAGAPLPPTNLQAGSSHNGFVPLSWDPYSQPNLLQYTIYRKDTTGTYLPVGTSICPEFTDYDVANGIEYTYRVTTTNDFRLESDLSDSATAIPMGLDEDLMVIIDVEGTFPLFQWESDSLVAYYHRLFDEIGEDPTFIYLEEDDPYPTLPELSPYRTIWIIGDNRFQELSQNDRTQRDQTIETYLCLGGNAIISGRKVLATFFLNQSGYTLITYPFLKDYFAVDTARAATWPPLTWPVGFVGADAAIPGYPSLNLDSAKVHQLAGPPYEYTMEVDGMVPTSWGESFYTYIASYPDLSEFHGMSCGVRYDSMTVLLPLPLYAMEPYESVLDLAENVLQYVRGDRFNVVDDGPEVATVPTEYSLDQNYPNPFNATTIIPFALPTASRVSLTIYNIIGQKVATVADTWMEAGNHRVAVDGLHLASGMYFYQLKAADYTAVKKMVLLK
jgi:hypothetical protein